MLKGGEAKEQKTPQIKWILSHKEEKILFISRKKDIPFNLVSKDVDKVWMFNLKNK